MSTLQTTIGSNIVTVNIPNNGALDGDCVLFSGINSSVGGIPASELNTNHIISNAQTNSFTIQVVTVASSTAGYDGPITATFDIHAGNATGVIGYGWGAGFWGRNTWGSGWSVPVYQPPRLFTQDRFNNDLIFCIRNADIYYWTYDDTFSSRAVLMSSLPDAADVPQLVGSILMSQQDRHLFAFGCTAYGGSIYDPLLIRWASQDAPEFWTPGNVIVPSTGKFSSAGFFRLTNGSEIIAAERTRQEILVFTDSTLYSIQYAGTEAVFAPPQQMADNISIISPAASITVNNITYWMGIDKFYAYNGRVETLPCTLRQYVFQDLNRGAADQVICGTNEQFNEVIWFYASQNSNEVNRYVIYNYLENLWYYGQLERTAWLDSPLREYPQAANSSGWIFDHERGTNDNLLPMTAYISSADFDIDPAGDQFMLIRRIIPDINFTGTTSNSATVKMTVSPRNFPGANYATNNVENTGLTKNVDLSTTVPIDQYTNQVFVRARGRQISYKVESDELDVQWQLGMPRVDARPDGRRS